MTNEELEQKIKELEQKVKELECNNDWRWYKIYQYDQTTFFMRIGYKATPTFDKLIGLHLDKGWLIVEMEENEGGVPSLYRDCKFIDRFAFLIITGWPIEVVLNALYDRMVFRPSSLTTFYLTK